MRKASQDGGDNTSITSGVENEIKKPGAGILKSTKNSIKRKVQNFSIESDDTANEPLLHKNKEKAEIEKQSAKFLISKTKTDSVSDRGDDRDKLLADDKITEPSISDVTRITRGATIDNGFKDQTVSQPISTSSIHNHMNTNVFNERTSNSIMPKSQVLVELDVSKPSGSRYSPSPLIFTAAKIHSDGTKQHMEPVHVTSVPILSTIEGGIVKTVTKQTDSEMSTANNDLKEITKNGIVQQIKEKELVAQGTKFPNLIEKVNVTSCQNISSNEKPQNNVKDINVLKNLDSDVSNSPIANKVLKNETLSSKGSSESSDNKNEIIGGKLTGNIKASENRISYTVSSFSGVNAIEKGPSFQASPSFDKSHVDINKNIQSPSTYKPFNNICSTKEKVAEVSPISVKDNTDNIDRNVSIIKASERSREQFTNKSYGFRNETPSKEITESNFPEKSTISISDSLKSKSIDKTPLAKTSEVAQSTNPAIQSQNVSNVNSAILKNTNSTSIVSSTISSPSTHLAASKTKATDSSKISTIPKYRDLKYSTNQDQLPENDLKSVSNVQIINKNTSASKSTPNNTVTVVSSITKAKPTASNIKMSDSSTSGISSSTKQSASPSTVRTVFSAKPSVKSSTVSAVPSVKSNLRSTLNEGDKSKSNVKSNTSGSTSYATAGRVADAQTLCSTKPTISSTLTKAQKKSIDNGSKIREPVKDSRGSKVDK